MSSRLPIGVGTTTRDKERQEPSTYSPDSSRARAAAPRTPDLAPKVASCIWTRSREGERARRWTSLRAGSRMSSPALATPPPMAITSGLKTLTKPASPMPSHTPVSSRTEMAASSPSWASSVTSSPSTFRSTASRPRAESGCSFATSRARRWIAVPDARASRQPWLPQPQRGPVAWMVTCPNSPPAPCAPRSKIPCITTPPPTPVPSVINTRCSTSLPAPNRNSPHAAAFASFSTVTDRPVLSPRSYFRGTPSIACRLGAKITLFSALRTNPGTARQTAPTSYPSLTSSTARAMLESSLSRGPADGYLISFKISPSGVTTPAAIFVPPTSTPIAFNAPPLTPLSFSPFHYLELRPSGVGVAAYRIHRIESRLGHRSQWSRQLRRESVPQAQEVHPLPELPRPLDPQALRDEDRPVVPASERREPLVPVQKPVRHALQRDLRVDLDRGVEDVRVLLDLRPHRPVHPIHESVEVAWLDREPRRLAVSSPLSEQVAHRKERSVKVHVRLPRTGRPAIGAIRPPVEDRRRSPRRSRDLARDQPREPPGGAFVRNHDLEILFRVHLGERPLHRVTGPLLPLGIELVEE